MDNSWVKVLRFGRFIVMLSKAPFYFGLWPTVRWKSLAWRRYEIKVVPLPK
jgi:hypothetical protein